MDVNRLNITLLRIFRQGVAAALGLLPQQVHINRLIVRCLRFAFPVQTLIFVEGFSNKEPPCYSSMAQEPNLAYHLFLQGKFYRSKPHPFVYILSMAAFVLQWQS